MIVSQVLGAAVHAEVCDDGGPRRHLDLVSEFEFAPHLAFAHTHEFGHDHASEHGQDEEKRPHDHERSECVVCLAAPMASDPGDMEPAFAAPSVRKTANRLAILSFSLDAETWDAVRSRGPPLS